VTDDWRRTMKCWNGLSPDQQEFLRTEGYLPFGFRYQGWCNKGAEVEIVMIYHDEFPGPRFYCGVCAIDYIATITGLGDAAESGCTTRC
jgi:hypothetical protein